jgi:hypothetical protein
LIPPKDMRQCLSERVRESTPRLRRTACCCFTWMNGLRATVQISRDRTCESFASRLQHVGDRDDRSCTFAYATRLPIENLSRPRLPPVARGPSTSTPPAGAEFNVANACGRSLVWCATMPDRRWSIYKALIDGSADYSRSPVDMNTATSFVSNRGPLCSAIQRSSST